MITPEELTYPYNALEPYIDALTMEIHYTKHYMGYVTKLNDAIAKYPELESYSLNDLLKNIDKIPDDIKMSVINNAGGSANHALFWKLLNPNGGGTPVDKDLLNVLEMTFGSFDDFKKQFTEAAVNRFGSGWAWLVLDKNGQMKIMSTPNQNSPITEGYFPILGLDVWEHAYYLKYQNRRPEYIENWWNVVNWDYVTELFREQTKPSVEYSV